MVLGFDEKRPEQKDYQEFIDNFASLVPSDLSIALFGSFVTGNHIPGNSDIDALVVFPHDIVIPKEYYDHVAFAYDVSKNSVPFQMSPHDITTINSPLFNSFMADYDAAFNKLVYINGPEINISLADVRSGTAHALSHNLRKTRKNYISRLGHDDIYVKGFSSAMNNASSFPRMIGLLLDDNQNFERFDNGFEKLGFETETYEKIKWYYTNFNSLDKLYKNKNEMEPLWFECVNYCENLIKSYLKKTT